MLITVLIICVKDYFFKEPTRKLLKEKFKKPLTIFERILYIVYFTTIFMWTNNHLNFSLYLSLLVIFLTLLVADIVMGTLAKKYL